MNDKKLKVIFITMSVSEVLHALLEASINIIGVIESKQRNPNKQTMELKGFCERNELPYYFMNEGCNNQLESWIKKLEPDLIVVYCMSELLKKNILEIPKKGCINLHPSLLPNYRGYAPFFWTFYNYDLNPGATVHYIDEGEDTGDIIYQESYSLPLGSTEEELVESLEYTIGVKLLIKAINDIENDCAPRKKQPIESSTERARKIHPNEYKKIVDWESWEIERVWHLLRGTQNWLNVFDFYEIKEEVVKWRILHFTKEDMNSQLKLGKVYKDTDGNYFLACKQGKIYMELLTSSSRRREYGTNLSNAIINA